MKEKAVIDRFEGNTAVLNIGEDERQMEAPRSSLPKSCKEGDWLQVELDRGKLVRVEADPDETERAHQRIAEKMAALLRGDHLK
jgi:Protein of unknown function (DUF3006)